MKIYTKTGDSGETGLFSGPRVRKDNLRIEAYGAVDELNAAIGLARAESPRQDIDELLQAIQNELFAVGAELATPDPASRGVDMIRDDHIAVLEQAIDRLEEGLPRLTQFILPGGGKAGAALHLARTICRRAERRVVSLARSDEADVSPRMMRYLNRLGDLLFVVARAANAAEGLPETTWTKPG